MDKKEKKSQPEPRTYTVEQIAAMLNIGRTTAYQLVKRTSCPGTIVKGPFLKESVPLPTDNGQIDQPCLSYICRTDWYRFFPSKQARLYRKAL